MTTDYNTLKSKPIDSMSLWEHAQMWHFEITGVMVEYSDPLAQKVYEDWVEFAFADFSEEN